MDKTSRHLRRRHESIHTFIGNNDQECGWPNVVKRYGHEFVETNETTNINLVPGGVYMENVRGQPTLSMNSR